MNKRISVFHHLRVGNSIFTKFTTAISSIWAFTLLIPFFLKIYEYIANIQKAQRQSHDLSSTIDKTFISLANAMPLLVLVGNAQGHVEFFNNAWKNYTGCEHQELLEGLGKGVFTHPDDYQRVGTYWQSQVQQGLAFECELRLKRHDNIYRWHLIHMAIIRQKGTIRQWIGTGTDINTQKSNEQSLRETSQRQDIFLTMISHELKTPLTSMQLLVSFIRCELTNLQYQQAILTIEEQLRRIIQLVNDLLDMSKIKVGQMSLTFIPCDAIKIVREAIAGIQISTNTHQLIMESNTEACHIEADPERLEQIIINLLTNAIKYSPEADRVDIRITTDGYKLLFAVQDYGIGISQAAQTHVFEQYYRSIEAAHQKYAGLGIGLYITNEIVKRHKGQLWVESGEGKGSIFSFSLPLKRED